MRFDVALGLELNRFEVDFHIPQLEQDARLALDPFLMFKSRHDRYVEWHAKLLRYWDHVLDLVRAGSTEEATETLVNPEPKEIRLGYVSDGAGGSGIGREIARDVVDLLSSNDVLLDRGLRHLEELQLYAVGIGADRLSDLTANVLKTDLIRYTAEQADLWGIPLIDDVGLKHAWHHEDGEWVDLVTPLPLDPDTGAPVVVVPRRVLRRLPWINYDDFRDHYLLGFLEGRVSRVPSQKRRVVELTRADLGLVDRYVDEKEARAVEAAPLDLDDRDKSTIERDAADLEKELAELTSGASNAKAYEALCLRILNSSLEPELIDGRPQQRTYEGTQIRDLIFVNDSDHTFWSYVRTEHKSFLVTFEIKNKDKLDPADLNQLHAYLGDATGYLGFLISRNGFTATDYKRAMTLYNKRTPHSVILGLSDQDLVDLVRWRKTPNGPSERLREIYRDFLTALQ
ncbi:MAG: hypothetical protein M3134_08990 [Actinomycetota bacterium]|nr:hypothetical protein [Actinomycetota bacterium]